MPTKQSIVREAGRKYRGAENTPRNPVKSISGRTKLPVPEHLEVKKEET